MKWRDFKDKKPPDARELHLRNKHFRPFKSRHHLSYSSGILWEGGDRALDQNFYEWLDEEKEDQCPCCGKKK